VSLHYKNQLVLLASNGLQNKNKQAGWVIGNRIRFESIELLKMKVTI
jgi:hypothetical protein